MGGLNFFLRPVTLRRCIIMQRYALEKENPADVAVLDEGVITILCISLCSLPFFFLSELLNNTSVGGILGLLIGSLDVLLSHSNCCWTKGENSSNDDSRTSQSDIIDIMNNI